MSPDEALRELADFPQSGVKVKRAIEHASRLAGLAYWRAFDIWYRKARRIEPSEIEQITDAVQLKREKAARNEIAELRLRLERLDAAFRQADANLHRPTIDLVWSPAS